MKCLPFIEQEIQNILDTWKMIVGEQNRILESQSKKVKDYYSEITEIMRLTQNPIQNESEYQNRLGYIKRLEEIKENVELKNIIELDQLYKNFYIVMFSKMEIVSQVIFIHLSQDVQSDDVALFERVKDIISKREIDISAYFQFFYTMKLISHQEIKIMSNLKRKYNILKHGLGRSFLSEYKNTRTNLNVEDFLLLEYNNHLYKVISYNDMLSLQTMLFNLISRYLAFIEGVLSVLIKNYEKSI